MQRTTVLLLFGGESSEHEVSVSSARNVYAAIDDEKYDVILGYIDEEGKWWLLDTFDMQIDTHSMPQLLPALGRGSFVTVPENKVIAPDVILPILHGRNGEDGSVQGLAQLLHIPIVGCGVEASAIAMDKVVCKKILEADNIKTTPYKVHRSGEDMPDFSKLNIQLGSPLFVKPSRAGSSVGVSQVYSEEGLAVALTEAHKHDPVVLIEQAIIGRELEVAVLGTPPHHRISDIGEIIPDGDFYSYKAKYATTSKTKTLVDIELETDIREKIKAVTSRIYEILGCEGLSRVDFLLSNNGEIYFNEINTLPGFTNISMYPKLWQQRGVSYSKLVEQLLDDAIDRATMDANV